MPDLDFTPEDLDRIEKWATTTDLLWNPVIPMLRVPAPPDPSKPVSDFMTCPDCRSRLPIFHAVDEDLDGNSREMLSAYCDKCDRHFNDFEASFAEDIEELAARSVLVTGIGGVK